MVVCRKLLDSFASSIDNKTWCVHAAMLLREFPIIEQVGLAEVACGSATIRLPAFWHTKQIEFGKLWVNGQVNEYFNAKGLREAGNLSFEKDAVERNRKRHSGTGREVRLDDSRALRLRDSVRVLNERSESVVWAVKGVGITGAWRLTCAIAPDAKVAECAERL